ncbi:carbonic anhydrase [Streptosporangium sp. KLBMP 9127]|nr:carbonic anhydrase [Streptosporangium sp. KLBMP 9127]
MNSPPVCPHDPLDVGVDTSQSGAAHRKLPARQLGETTVGDGPGRRTLLTAAASLAVAGLVGCSSAEVRNEMHTAPPASRTGPAPGAPKAAYQRLMEGNRRWVANALLHPDRDPTRRELLAASQQPYGAVLSCIDSRVPPELVFDTGLGDLFVMRSGGGAAGPVITGSIEYGPMTSGTPLIVVLGHQRCGAVSAAYRALREGKPLPGNLQAITKALRPAYEQAVRESSADPADTMARAQVKLTADALRSNRDLAPLVAEGVLAVVSAYYSLDTGQVEILNGAPV